METLVFRLCGAVTAVDCTRTQDAEVLRAYFAPAIAANLSELVPRMHARISESEVEILQGPSVPRRRELQPLLELEWLITRWATALRQSAVLHTGCVIFDGVPLLFVAPSGSGKSTMTLAAIRANAEYVTDDLLILEKSCAFGFARAIRFKDLSTAEVGRTPYLNGMDTWSYVLTLRGEPRVFPLYAGKMQTRHQVNFSELPPPVVVRVAQGTKPSLEPLSSLDRAIILHEAAITEHQEYDGSLGPGPTYDLVWRDPEESFQMLAQELGRLKSQGL
jgi:hypothetical protein